MRSLKGKYLRLKLITIEPAPMAFLGVYIEPSPSTNPAKYAAKFLLGYNLCGAPQLRGENDRLFLGVAVIKPLLRSMVALNSGFNFM